MKLMLLISLYFHLLVPDLMVYRKLLDTSLENKKAANQFYKQFSKVQAHDEPLLVGFKAMSEFMMSKHLINPMSKYSHFNKGRDLLENAIKRDGNSAELLFFRLTLQSTVPSFLGYHDHINDDKQNLIFYLKAAKKQDADKVLYERIKTYLLINKYCSTEEKILIKSL